LRAWRFDCEVVHATDGSSGVLTSSTGGGASARLKPGEECQHRSHPEHGTALACRPRPPQLISRLAMAALNETRSDPGGPGTIEEQLAIQELLEHERAAERDMQDRLRRCKWLTLDQSLWGAQWSCARMASDSGNNENFPVPPVAADGEECCPVCLYPPLLQQRVALDCCKTVVCQVIPQRVGP
jgi:hypothetical protein